MDRARAKVAAAGAPADVSALLRAADSARTVAKRMQWLHRAADRHLEPLAAVSACRRGCTHCCHIAVTITDAEAQLLAQASGRRAVRPAVAVRREDLQAMVEGDRLQVDALDAGPVPCALLSDDVCSVYAARPLACRAQLNLDDDALLCQLVPGVDVPVPYADATSIRAMWLVLQPSALYADIRLLSRRRHRARRAEGMTARVFNPRPAARAASPLHGTAASDTATSRMSIHLDAVAAVLDPCRPLAQLVGYLHDVCEDTRHHGASTPRQELQRSNMRT